MSSEKGLYPPLIRLSICRLALLTFPESSTQPTDGLIESPTPSLRPINGASRIVFVLRASRHRYICLPAFRVAIFFLLPLEKQIPVELWPFLALSGGACF